MKNSKFVTSYFAVEHAHGIIALTFNTTERWIPYHRYSEETYAFGEEPENESFEDYEKRVQEIPEFLPDRNYIVTELQEKDQITFHFIPREHFFADKKILLHEKTIE